MIQPLVFLQNFLDFAGLSASLLIAFAVNFCAFIGLISSNESISFGHFLQVSEVTHLLAEVLASLLSKGYGIPEEQVNDSGHETSQDASGTGMGEGTGTNDVSDQIQDEDQLLGTSEKVKKLQL